MRFLAAFVAVAMLAVIIGSTGMVLTKEYEPRLSVQIKGVPAYVYYNRPYDITIAYNNRGGAVDGPVELSALLPPTFALAGPGNPVSEVGKRLVWQLDGLGQGETGSVQLTVRGTLPEDLTDAVYDLPGYVGHTAFVEGFELNVSLTAGSISATALAVADTGTPTGGTGTIVIIKDTLPDSPTVFTFTSNIPGCIGFTLEDDGIGGGNQVICSNVDVGQYTVTENDPIPLNHVLIGLVCTTEGPGPAGVTPANVSALGLQDRTANIVLGADETVTCVFTNATGVPSQPQPDPPTATPTATPTRTATPTATATVTPTVTVTPGQGAGSLGSIFAPNPSPIPTARQGSPSVVIQPPSTGDAGLNAP